MPLPFRGRRKALPTALEQEPRPRDSLLENGLLSGWFMQYRVEEELERARRYKCPLTILHAAPVLLPTEKVSDSLLEAGAAAAQKIARRTDLLGWWRGSGIMIIMPETDMAGAEATASRWRTDLYLKTHSAGARKWRVRAIDATQLKGTDDLFAAPQPAREEEAA